MNFLSDDHFDLIKNNLTGYVFYKVSQFIYNEASKNDHVFIGPLDKFSLIAEPEEPYRLDSHVTANARAINKLFDYSLLDVPQEYGKPKKRTFNKRVQKLKRRLLMLPY